MLRLHARRTTGFWLVIAGVSIIFICLFSYVLVHGVYQHHVGLMKARALETIAHLQYVLPRLAPEEQQNYLEHAARQAPDLSYLLLADAQGSALAHSDPARRGMNFGEAGLNHCVETGEIVEQLYVRDADKPDSPHHGERTVDVLAPLRAPDGGVAGVVNVGLSLASVRTARDGYRDLAILGSGLWVLFVLAFGGVYLRLAWRRRQAEEARRRSERIFGALVEHSPDIVIRLDAEGRFLYLSPRAEECMGVPAADLQGHRLGDLSVAQYFREAWGQAIADTRRKRTVQSTEYRLPDGSWIDWRLAPELDNEGEMAAITVVGRDVSTRHHMEQALRLSEGKYRAIFNTTGSGMLIADGDGRILEANRTALSWFAPDGGDLDGHVAEIVAAETEDLVSRATAPEVPQATAEVEVSSTCADGRPIELAVMASAFEHQEERHVLLVMRDITILRRERSRLHASEERLRTIAENIPSGILVIGQDYRIREVNSRTCEITGYQRDELLGQLCDIVCPKGSASKRCPIWEGGTGGFTGMDTRIRCRDGHLAPIIKNAKCIELDGEECILEIFLDISTLKQAEAELLRLATAIEQASETIVICDAKGRIEYANPAFHRNFGEDLAAVDGSGVQLLARACIDSSERARIWARLRAGEHWEGRVVSQDNEGREITEEVGISPVRDAGGQITNYVAVRRDITREVALAEQLRQAQKMEAIGQLTGGVAHDFNNLLQIINGYTEIVLATLPSESPTRRRLQEVAKAGSRAATLVGQLLAFSRRQVMKPEPLDLNAVVADLMKMIRRLIGAHIELQYTPAPMDGLIHADRGMIDQVLLNLCVNARDAMPDGGVLAIRTGCVEVDAAVLAEHPDAVPGPFAWFEVADTGCGMDAHTLEHMYEPFFTTKPVDVGTGLGLSTVYGIVTQHGGLLAVSSEVDKGTTFRISLPLRPVTPPEHEQPSPSVRGGTETILLAEDDPVVRQLACDVLHQAGYSVIPTANGAEAVTAYTQRRQQIDLLLFDMVMPVAGGREACNRIRQLGGNVPVLFATGYTHDTVDRGKPPVEDLQLLRKPFRCNDLLRRVRAVLDEPPVPA